MASTNASYARTRFSGTRKFGPVLSAGPLLIYLVSRSGTLTRPRNLIKTSLISSSRAGDVLGVIPQ